MLIRRKKNKQAKQAKRNARKQRERDRARDPGYIDIVIGHYGPQDEFFDDCPICQELRASGEIVYTLDERGELVPMTASIAENPGIN
jgi:hypothetical protein